MANNYPVILSVLTGSRAYGLARADSDWDIRAVHVKPTSELLSIGPTEKIEPAEEHEGNDYVSIEVGRFLQLSANSNPTILEMYMAPTLFKPPYIPSEKSFTWGVALAHMFDDVWDGNKAYQAYLGYASAQRDRLFKRETTVLKVNKLAIAWLRTLEQGAMLFNHGRFTLDVKTYLTGNTLRKWQYMEERLELSDIVPVVEPAEQRLHEAYKSSSYKEKKPDWEHINEFLLRIRKAYWE